MKRNWRNGRALLPAVAILTAAAGVTVIEHPSILHAAALGTDSTNVKRAAAPTAAVAHLADLSDAFATIAAHVKPSVVYITAKQAAQPVSQRSRSHSQQPDMQQ